MFKLRNLAFSTRDHHLVAAQCPEPHVEATHTGKTISFMLLSVFLKHLGQDLLDKGWFWPCRTEICGKSGLHEAYSPKFSLGMGPFLFVTTKFLGKTVK